MIKVNGIEVTKGCTVRFRCGGEAVVRDCCVLSRVAAFTIYFEGYERGVDYYRAGSYFLDLDHILDIIEVIPPAFNWDDVKAGMAFSGHRTLSGNIIVWYVSPSPIESDAHIFTTKGYGFWQWETDEIMGLLTRAPEHDIEVR